MPDTIVTTKKLPILLRKVGNLVASGEGEDALRWFRGVLAVDERPILYGQGLEYRVHTHFMLLVAVV